MDPRDPGYYSRILEQARPHMQRAERQVWCPYKPNSEPQRQFVESDQFELMMGGGTGSGKTIGVGIAASKYFHVPGYKALVIRRTYPSLAAPDGPIWMFDNWLRDTPAQWQAMNKRWIFPTGGEPAVLQFGVCQYADDLQKLMGPSWNFVAIDELGEYDSPRVWTSLKTRFRHPEGFAVPPRLRATGNPGGPGQQWIYEQIVQPDGGKRYIHSTYRDNVSIDRDAYREVLETMDETSRRYYIEGDWTAKRTGRIYPIEDKNLMDGFSPIDDENWRYILGMDLGSSAHRDPLGYTVMAFDHYTPQMRWVLKSYKRPYQGIAASAAEVNKLRDEFPELEVWIDPGGLGQPWIDEFQDRYGIPCDAVPKKPGYKFTARRYVADALALGHIMVYREQCRDLIDQAAMVVWDEKGLDAEANAETDVTDSFLYADMQCRAHLSEEPELPPRTPKEAADREAAAMRRRAEEYAEAQLTEQDAYGFD